MTMKGTRVEALESRSSRVQISRSRVIHKHNHSNRHSAMKMRISIFRIRVSNENDTKRNIILMIFNDCNEANNCNVTHRVVCKNHPQKINYIFLPVIIHLQFRRNI